MADRIDESERRGASTDRFLDGETLVVLALFAVGVLGCMFVVVAGPKSDPHCSVPRPRDICRNISLPWRC